MSTAINSNTVPQSQVDEVMTAEDVAAFLKINLATVYRLYKTKQLPGATIGRRIRFLRSQIMAVLLEGLCSCPNCNLTQQPKRR